MVAEYRRAVCDRDALAESERAARAESDVYEAVARRMADATAAAGCSVGERQRPEDGDSPENGGGAEDGGSPGDDGSAEDGGCPEDGDPLNELLLTFEVSARSLAKPTHGGGGTSQDQVRGGGGW